MRKFIDSDIIKTTNDMTFEEWLEARKDGIGGSDASSVLGLNPYRSIVSVYMDKVRIREESNKENKDLVGVYNNVVQKNKTYKMELGNKLEDFFAKKEWQNEVPIHTQIQVYHYMDVSGATHIYD